MCCNAMVHAGHLSMKIAIKTSCRNCFFERTNHEFIIDRFSHVIHYRCTAHSFVESQATLLNAYKEPGIKSLLPV